MYLNPNFGVLPFQLTCTIIMHEVGHLIDWLPDYTLKRGNGATPEVFTAIEELVSFDGPGNAERGDITMTHTLSTGVETKGKLPDFGTFSFVANMVLTDTVLMVMEDDYIASSQTPVNYRLVYYDGVGTYRQFAAIVKKFQHSGAADDKVPANVGLRITGGLVKGTGG